MKLSFIILFLIFGIHIGCDVINASTSNMTSLEDKPINCSRFVKHKNCFEIFCQWCNKTCGDRPKNCFDEEKFLKIFEDFCSSCERRCMELPDDCPSERKYHVPFYKYFWLLFILLVLIGWVFILWWNNVFGDRFVMPYECFCRGQYYFFGK